MYELWGVLTHTGRSADSGHYMAWTKNDKGTDYSPFSRHQSLIARTKGIWQKYDDDKVSDVKEDEIAQLDGGGDRAMAYLLLYKSKPLQ